MQVLLINGSPHPKGSTATALATVARQLEKAGIETTTLHVGHKAIRGCIACGKCAQTGLCVFKDDPVNECIERMREADGLVVGSPVYYAGPNAGLCALLDRMFYMKSAPYAFKPAAAVVSCRRGGASASFDRLNKYFTIARMPVVSSQYWNSIHGNNAEEAVQDAEGLQIMRTLGDNMAWLLHCIEAGRKAGITPPVVEAWQPTNSSARQTGLYLHEASGGTTMPPVCPAIRQQQRGPLRASFSWQPESRALCSYKTASAVPCYKGGIVPSGTRTISTTFSWKEEAG